MLKTPLSSFNISSRLLTLLYWVGKLSPYVFETGCRKPVVLVLEDDLRRPRNPLGSGTLLSILPKTSTRVSLPGDTTESPEARGVESLPSTHTPWTCKGFRGRPREGRTRRSQCRHVTRHGSRTQRNPGDYSCRVRESDARSRCRLNEKTGTFATVPPRAQGSGRLAHYLRGHNSS